jgi:hypothetical protein
MTSSLRQTISLLCDCWTAAERNTAQHLKRYNPKAREEFITDLFWGFLNNQLKEATKDRRLKRAFEADLVGAIPNLQFGDSRLRLYSENLFMECNLHNRNQEAITGGDFGLTILRPSIPNTVHHASINMKYQGLLCQAKLKNRNGKWQPLSKNQKKILPKNASFAALVFYQFSDVKRRLLGPFLWQPCHGANRRKLEGWLRDGVFPSIASSTEAITAVAEGRLGTDDRAIIEKMITLEERPTLAIRIDWPDDKKPPSLGALQYIHTTAPPALVFVHV